MAGRKSQGRLGRTMAHCAAIQHLLWDVAAADLDLERHKAFIIARVLQFGTPAEVRWLLATYAEADIIATVRTSRNLDRRTANFWSVHFGIPAEEIRCLQTSWLQDCFP